jgi:hypothetical protein
MRQAKDRAFLAAIAAEFQPGPPDMLVFPGMPFFPFF